jgi:endo-1,4-beta-xylanase
VDLSAGRAVEGASTGDEPSLRPLADQRGLFLGTSTGTGVLQRAEDARLMVKHFNMIAIENAMKWEVVHPEPERYDFSQGDALVAFAEANGMEVYGHVLVWDLQQPEWLTRSEVELAGQRTREEWIQILCRHIKTVVSHYRGHIYAWDVVNETLNNDGSLRDTLWMRVIGPEHIGMAFQWAREADPHALLILNEFFAEGLNEKSEAVYSLAQGLLQLGIPVDGVGLQMHIWLGGPPTQDELKANMQRLADLGLVVHITEMDVRTQYNKDPPEIEFEQQAEHYRQAMQACLEAVNCNVFITWGLTDRHSWIPGYTGVPDAPLLFDEQSRLKPAFNAILELLRR